MRVSVDRNLCETIANCIDTAPGVFDFDADDNLVILLPDVPPDREADVRLAVETCPMLALRLEE